MTNLEEYALLLHYNQIGSVAEFETRIGELERSFSFIVGEVVQLQPAGAATPTNQTALTTAATSQPAPVTSTQPTQQASQVTQTTTAATTSRQTKHPETNNT